MGKEEEKLEAAIYIQSHVKEKIQLRRFDWIGWIDYEYFKPLVYVQFL